MTTAQQVRHIVAEVRGGVLDWIESVRDRGGPWGRWKYHAAMQVPWALQASGLAVCILDDLGALPDAGDPRRSEAIASFQACQDPADGLFKDPYETPDRHTGSHTWEQVWGQRHGATLEALMRLGGAPKRPLPEAQFADLSKVDARAWTLEAPEWENPWKHGESWSRAIAAYWGCQQGGSDCRQHPNLMGAFEAMESEILDPITGTPNRRMPDPNPSVAMAGLFKVLVGYLRVGRPFPFAKQAIDSTLALQHEDGDWGIRRNMCIVWDSLWVLRQLDLQLRGSHRHTDLVVAGNRTAEMLLEVYRKGDGAFAFAGEHCTTNHHSIQLCDRPSPISDMLGTTMALRCLGYADEWNGVGQVSASDARLI